MRIEIHLPDTKKFKDKLQALADAEGRSRKNWLERLVLAAVEGHMADEIDPKTKKQGNGKPQK
jgi:hypothetical protein